MKIAGIAEGISEGEGLERTAGRLGVDDELKGGGGRGRFAKWVSASFDQLSGIEAGPTS